MSAMHFKYSQVKGSQLIPMSPNMFSMFAHLDRALASTMPSPPTYFFKKTDGMPYSKEYFSTICGNLLVFEGQRFTSNQLRGMFVTGWRDFMQHPSTFVVREQIEQVTLAASGMLLNSPEAWGAYDNSTIDRTMNVALAMWPKFQAFMKEQHLDLVSREPWDPTSANLASLDLS